MRVSIATIVTAGLLLVPVALSAPAPSSHTESKDWPPPKKIPGFTYVNPNAPAPPTPKNGYKATGKLTKPLVMPHTPAGGLDTDPKKPPVYNPLSDFDFQSLNLALNQEWIEYDLFHYALRKFSVKEFEEAGLNAEHRFLIQYMADQEIGHSQVLSNILGPAASWPCEYEYPFKTVREFIDFSQKLTRFGESGVLGFIEHLDSRPSANLLVQSITVESRQQLIFRQFQGLFAMPFWHVPGITQSMAWTLLAPYLKSCPKHNPKMVWANFPALRITNNPNGTDPNFGPTITHNRTALSYPGRVVELEWDDPGKKVGPDKAYTTDTTAGAPKFAAWISQLNTTYTPLYNVRGNKGYTKQPSSFTWPTDPHVNGTMFVLLSDQDLFVTPANLSLLNPHVRAGPALYQSG